jgi:MFS family permease
VFRSVGGIGSALFFAALLSFLLRTIPPQRSGRVMSVYYGSFNVGFMAGGPLGGLVANWFGLASPLHVYGIACFLSAWLFWRTIHNPARSIEETRRGGIRRLPWNRPFVTVLVTNGAYAWMVGAMFSTLIPLFGVDELGLTLSGVGIGLAIATGTELISLFPAGKATDRRGRRAVLVPSLAALAAIIAVFGLLDSVTIFYIGMAVLGVASGYAGVPPAPMLSDVTPDDLKGSAVAAFRFMGDLGFALGPLAAGWTADAFGFEASFASSALPILLALALVLSIRETLPSRTSPRAG